MMTIKEHLDAIRKALEYYRNDEIDQGDTPYEANEALQRIEAITTMIDKPTKIAEEWAEKLKEHCGFGDFGCSGCLDIIRAIQQDARLNQDPILEAQNAVLREALENLAKAVGDEPCVYDHSGNCQTHFISKPCEQRKARYALDYTPSDVSEMVLVPKVPTHSMIMEMSMCCGGSYDQIKENWPRMIEAARAAGVEVE